MGALFISVGQFNQGCFIEGTAQKFDADPQAIRRITGRYSDSREAGERANKID